MKSILCVLLFLCGCQSAHLRVRTEYMNESYLAGSQIESPYLTSSCFCGEQLVIKYSGACLPASLRLYVRLSNHEIKEYTRNIQTKSGYWVYRLINEEYQCLGPILGYKVELWQGETCMNTFSHLWADAVIN